MTPGRWLLHIPGRWLAPLLLVVCAVLSFAVYFAWQLSQGAQEAVAQESRRLQDRLVFEQIRLYPLLDEGDADKIRSKVAAMPGLDRAYLVGAGGVVQASLSSADIGQVLARLSHGFARTDGAERLQAGGGTHSVQVRTNAAGTALLGRIGLGQDRALIVQQNIAPVLVARKAALRNDMWRGAAVLVVGVGLLAWTLHLVWFRRAKRLADMLAAMGAGDLDPQAGLGGGDELALIGAEANRLASRLRLEQAQLRRVNEVVNRSPAVVIEWLNAPGWPIRYMSDMVTQWGFAREDFVQGRVLYNDLLHPDDVARVNREIEGYFLNGPDSYRQEYRIRCADGHWAWIDDRTTLERDDGGRVVSITGVLLDITPQKAAQLAQQEQAGMLQLFYDLPFIGMAITSPVDKRWLQVNDRLCEMLGYSREALLGMTWAELTPDADMELNLPLFNGLLRGDNNGYRLRKRFRHREGRVVHVEIDVKAVRNPDGHLQYLLTTVEDITDRLKADQAVRTQKAALERAETMVRLGSWSFDAATHEAWWSDQMYVNMGWDKALGPPSLDQVPACVHPDDRQTVTQALQGLLRGDALPPGDFRTDPAQGPVRWLRGTVERQGQPGTTDLKYSGTLLDVTPIKEAEAALRRVNEELEQRVQVRTNQLSAANQELEAFSYTVSHDLKAPLRGIDGYSALLEEEFGPQLGEEGREFLARVRQGVGQMGALITDLLSYSRMERQTMAVQTVPLSPLIRELLDQCSADVAQHGTQVTVDVQDLAVQGDREGLAVVLRNLIGNAIKFSADRTPPVVGIGAGIEAGRLRVWVRDNGVGFDMKYHDRMFAIFQRLHHAEVYPGTGVGLALVMKAVQRMGGRVWAESEPGQGATFLMEFPL